MYPGVPSRKCRAVTWILSPHPHRHQWIPLAFSASAHAFASPLPVACPRGSITLPSMITGAVVDSWPKVRGADERLPDKPRFQGPIRSRHPLAARPRSFGYHSMSFTLGNFDSDEFWNV